MYRTEKKLPFVTPPATKSPLLHHHPHPVKAYQGTQNLNWREYLGGLALGLGLGLGLGTESIDMYRQHKISYQSLETFSYKYTFFIRNKLSAFMYSNASSSPSSKVCYLLLKTSNNNSNPYWATVMKEIGCIGFVRHVVGISSICF